MRTQSEHERQLAAQTLKAAMHKLEEALKLAREQEAREREHAGVAHD